jgi:hypothetical protein
MLRTRQQIQAVLSLGNGVVHFPIISECRLGWRGVTRLTVRSRVCTAGDGARVTVTVEARKIRCTPRTVRIGVPRMRDRRGRRDVLGGRCDDLD